MTARMKVYRSRSLFIAKSPDPWSWLCRDIECKRRYGGWFTSQGEALSASCAHLAAHHTAQMPPRGRRLMSIDRRGHQDDTDQPVECVCGEIVRCPEAHACKPIGWTEPVTVPDPPEAYIPLRPDQLAKHRDRQEPK